MKKTRLNERLQQLAGIKPLYKINEGPALPGDANDDGVVNDADLELVQNNWLQQGANIPGDVNNDEIVNLDDLTMVIIIVVVRPSIINEFEKFFTLESVCAVLLYVI